MLYHALLGFYFFEPIFNLEYMNFMDLIMHAILSHGLLNQ